MLPCPRGAAMLLFTSPTSAPSCRACLPCPLQGPAQSHVCPGILQNRRELGRSLGTGPCLSGFLVTSHIFEDLSQRSDGKWNTSSSKKTFLKDLVKCFTL